MAVTRGLVSKFKAIKFGQESIRTSLREQFAELKGDAGQEDSAGHAGEIGRYPGGSRTASGKGGRTDALRVAVLIGEMGVPFDMRPTAVLGLAKGSSGPGDYKESAKVGTRWRPFCAGAHKD